MFQFAATASDAKLGNWWILIIGTPLVFTGYTLFVLFGAGAYEAEKSVSNAALFGDSFGVINALFSGLAFLLLVITLQLQRTELKEQRAEFIKMTAADSRHLHMELQKMALDDPVLMSVWYPNEELDWYIEDDNGKLVKQDRQIDPNARTNTYVNLILANWERQFNDGDISADELDSLFASRANNKFFESFWALAAESRAQHAKTNRMREQFHSLASKYFDNPGS